MKRLETVRNLCAILLFFILVSLWLGGWTIAQAPPKSFPDHDVAYTCTPTEGGGAPVQFKFTTAPAPRFDVYVGSTPVTGDIQSPVIVSVTNSAGLDVTAGAVKLLAANNGLPITINASDNVGIVGGRLDVDGKLGTPFGNGIDVLPSPFYVRWNSKTVSSSVHNFKLIVWDSSQNRAEKSWSMTK